MGYDIIGDIHGQAEKLEALLAHLGYRMQMGAWRHPSRTAIFVGDFIDRGEKGVETVRIVRGMQDAGSAMAVMGNHELNAIAWHTPDPLHPGEYLRPRVREPWGTKNRKQHAAFLAQVERDPELHAEIVDWFLTLPLWIDLPALRVVHACWHSVWMAWLAPHLREGRFLHGDRLSEATTPPLDEREQDTPVPTVFKAVEALLKGIEVPIPESHAFADKDGTHRARVRTSWWNTTGRTYRELALLPDPERQALPELEVPPHARPTDSGPRPVFFGHYWMTGSPRLQSASAVCVDYSAGKGGPLVAYRHEDGQLLAPGQFAWLG